MLRNILVTAVVLAVLPLSRVAADTYYVSNSGSDTNSGRSETQAWRTLGHACNSLYAGDILLIMGGTWDEDNDVPAWQQNGTLVPRNSGSLGNPIVIKAHPNYDRPVIRGSTTRPYRYAIAVAGVDYIRLESLVATGGLRGIHIQGANFISVKNCVSHHSRSEPEQNGGGFFIGYTDPCYACTVAACSIYSNYEMSGDHAAENVSGIHCYRNRRSVFEDNVIWDFGGGGNGIRLKLDNDSCIVRRNIIFDGSNGIRIGSDAQYNEVYDNVIYDVNGQSLQLRSLIGYGYSRSAHNKVFNNTIYAMNAQSGINIGHNMASDAGPLENIDVFNNIVVYVPGDRDNLHVTNHNHQNLWIDYNCYWNPNGDLDVVEWKDHDYTLSQFQSAIGLDQHSINVDPEFVNTTNRDFRPADSTSEVATGGRGSFYTPLSGSFNRSFMGAAEPLGYQGEPPENDINSPAAIADLNLTETGTADNLATGIVPNVSSTYTGYNPAVITDGTIDPEGGEGTTWASTENSTSPHWIEVDFASTRTVEQVAIYWAWNSYSSAWMTSQQYYIQRWDGNQYVTVGVVNSPPVGPVTTTTIPATSTTSIRIYQAANMGPASYASIMWLTELEIYGY